jgi:hypothetical protein
MRYREIQPATRLRSFIASYWTLDQDGGGEAQRVVPDGHAELILNLGWRGTQRPPLRFKDFRSRQSHRSRKRSWIWLFWQEISG